MVVPTFAPIIIGIDAVRLKIPEFTRLTTIIVVVAELCVATVIKKPTINPLNGLSVNFSIIFLKFNYFFPG